MSTKPTGGAAKQADDLATLKINEQKWSPTLMKAGWNVIPNIIIERQRALGLDAIDMNIIVHLSHYWWKAENLPHPSVKTIAAAIGLKPRTVQKHIKRLENANLLERHERRRDNRSNDTNTYGFNGLISAATPFAEEKIIEIETAVNAKKARIASRKPKLSVVKS